MVSINGKVLKALPNASFEVEIAGGQTIIAYLSGKLRTNNIMIAPGDIVSLELSPYDLKRGRIVYRL